MFQDDDIKVINSINTISSLSYKTNTLPELLKEKLEQIMPNENNYDRCISQIKLIENFIIIITSKISKNIPEPNSIKVLGYEISIIKIALNPGEEKTQINISLPLKEPKIIASKHFIVNKYLFCDFLKISEDKNYFLIHIFEQLHIYKIYVKENQLKYNKVELKKFNEKTKALYLGEYFDKNKNVVEFEFILKPMNNLLILEINLDDKSQKIEEKIYEFENIYKNIFYKFYKSYCGKFLFTGKEKDKNYLIYRNNGDIVIKNVDLNILNKNDDWNSNFSNYLFTCENDLYLLLELPKENENEDGFIILGIFNLYYNKDKDMYEAKLIQKILVRNKEGNKDYSIKIIMDKNILIQTGENLLYIQLDENSSVEKIYLLNTNEKEFGISKIFCSKYNQYFILLSTLEKGIFVSKIAIDNCNDIENNFLINNEEKDSLIIKENINEIIKINNNEQEVEKPKNENEKDNIYTSDVLKGIISNLDGYIDKIINERFQINNEKLVSLKELYEKKFEMIEEDILAQKKENDKLEKSLDELLNKISELKEPNIERKDSLGSENSVEKGLNSLKNINEMFKTPSSAPKNEINNANFPPFIKQLNSMRMIYPLNFFGNENMFNNPMMMNNPRIMQIMNNSFMNQANNLFQKKK